MSRKNPFMIFHFRLHMIISGIILQFCPFHYQSSIHCQKNSLLGYLKRTNNYLQHLGQITHSLPLFFGTLSKQFKCNESVQEQKTSTQKCCINYRKSFTFLTDTRNVGMWYCLWNRIFFEKLLWFNSWSFLLLYNVRGWSSLALNRVFPDLTMDCTSYSPECILLFPHTKYINSRAWLCQIWSNSDQEVESSQSSLWPYAQRQKC